ncbi:Reverse transcriptase (RNA-dependent DNA polymerase) [Priestia flexa]|nr:Reverse transcriptase (RNA-dependent DNA polymerase) [Priestia flexa]
MFYMRCLITGLQYIKGNFADSRVFSNIEDWNNRALQWLVYKKTYKPNGGYAIDPKCKIGRVLYADDFVIVTETKEQAESMYGKLTPYLQKPEINLSQEKTRVTHIEDGFDFLGFSLR